MVRQRSAKPLFTGSNPDAASKSRFQRYFGRFLDDPIWSNWSESQLERYSAVTNLFVNPIVYTEVSIAFQRIEEMEAAVIRGGFQMLDIPKED